MYDIDIPIYGQKSSISYIPILAKAQIYELFMIPIYLDKR